MIGRISKSGMTENKDNKDMRMRVKIKREWTGKLQGRWRREEIQRYRVRGKEWMNEADQ